MSQSESVRQSASQSGVSLLAFLLTCLLTYVLTHSLTHSLTQLIYLSLAGAQGLRCRRAHLGPGAERCGRRGSPAAGGTAGGATSDTAGADGAGAGAGAGPGPSADDGLTENIAI